MYLYFRATCPLMKEEDLGDMPIVNPNNYMFEAHRLYSLLVSTWRNKNISIYDLAKNGFYFTGQDDNCRCVFCKLEVRGWEQGDTAETEHRRWNPRCAFLQPNNQTGNKAIGEEQTDEVGHDHISNPFVRTNIAQCELVTS
jgi:Inhibitor of Apoptosis domain